MSDIIISVVSLIADKDKVVFYLQDGTTKTVLHTDPRLAKLVEKVMPLIERGEVATVSLDDYSLYSEFSKLTNKAVEIFKTFKSKVAALTQSLDEYQAEFMKGIEALQTEAEVSEEDAKAIEELKQEAPLKPKAADLVEHFEPVSNDTPLKEDETLVAVINGVAIPGIENLKEYIASSLRTNSAKGITAFLERIARVIDQRGHSIPDLMRFLERGDLPLADDGSIIAYKILRKSKQHAGFTYVDCHSQKVHQRVGTYVRVEEKLVDKNRYNECSNGLHVARRGYIGHFSGDVCTIIKMAPEDVIAVPHRDADKVRAMGYHIVAELPDHVYNVLRSNKPMTSDSEASALLADIIAGNHVGVLEEVWIGGQLGSNLSVKKIAEAEPVKKSKKSTDVSKKAKAFDDIDTSTTNPRELNKKLKAEREKIAEETKVTATKSEIARDLYNTWFSNDLDSDLQKLKDLKKSAKVSWTKLGFTEEEVSIIKSGTRPVIKTNRRESTGSFSILDQAIELFNREKFTDLKAFVKSKKKSLASLGFTPEEIDTINK